MGPFVLPALPSLPSVRSLLNTSPPLIYPSNEPHHSRARSRSRSHSRSQSAAGFYETESTPTKSRNALGVRDAGGGGRPLLPASPSANENLKDLAEWEPIKRRSSITSLNSMTSHNDRAVDCFGSSHPPYGGRASPVRPQHRRTQSAVPRQVSSASRPLVSPLGRLHEISRNPLASTSAISLPTLAEMDQNQFDRDEVEDGALSSLPCSPLVRPRTRKLSRSSLIEPPSPGSPNSSRSQPVPVFESRSTSLSTSCSSSADSMEARRGKVAHGRSFSSVPPPQVMGPPPLPLGRHCSSPRSRSVTEARPPETVLGRRSSISSTSSVSDVAVLAKWTFPSLERSEADRRNSGDISKPSEKLKDRLRHLSSLDTTSPTHTSSLPSVPSKSLLRSSTVVKSRPLHLAHRHTHSSPTNMIGEPPAISISGPAVLNGHGPCPMLPPPRPTRPAMRRPTTSRLRNPNPLSMPVDVPTLPPMAGQPGLSGSPASIESAEFPSTISDIVPSPTNSVVSLPPLQTKAWITADASAAVEGKTRTRKNSGLSWFRSKNVEESQDSGLGLTLGDETVDSVLQLDRTRSGESSDSDEEYMNYEDI